MRDFDLAWQDKKSNSVLQYISTRIGHCNLHQFIWKQVFFDTAVLQKYLKGKITVRESLSLLSLEQSPSCSDSLPMLNLLILFSVYLIY